MSNQSITLLHTDREDVVGLSRNIQTTVNRVNQLIGVNKPLETPVLSKLEKPEAPEVATFTEATARLNQLVKEIKLLQDQLAEIDAFNTELEGEVEILQLASRFTELPSTDFNNVNWGDFTGNAYETKLGSELSNPPTGITLSAGASYQVFGRAVSEGGYSETVQLIGNSQNRVFVRSGSDFTNAIANGWKEL